MNTMRKNRALCYGLAGLLAVVGCGLNGDFLGLEDYQRDLLTGGLLAAALLNGAGDGGAGAPADGRDGVDGLSCWDANGNGQADPEEDVNGDGAFDTLDCAGADGAGSGLACWDLNGDGVGDANEDINNDGIFDALDCRGLAGPDGDRGSDGDDGSRGNPGARGPELFDIFVDDFFSAGPVVPGMRVEVVSIAEPALGGPSTTADVLTDAIAYRVPVPEIYNDGKDAEGNDVGVPNDVNMRIFFYRVGRPAPDQCFIFRLDARRLSDGFGAVPYDHEQCGGNPGTNCGTRWIRIDPDSDSNGGAAGPIPPPGVLVVVDLPINTSAGLGFPNDLERAQFLAFELSTHRPDGAIYELIGVEFFEAHPGAAALRGATVFTSGNPEDEEGASCAFTDCNRNSIPDERDIAAGTSDDCNENAIPDECDIDDGTSKDCNENGTPDECELGGPATLYASQGGDEDGVLYVLDPFTGELTFLLDLTDEFPQSDMNSATGLALAPDGQTLYISTRYSEVLVAYDLISGVATAVGVFTDGKDEFAVSDLAFLPDGTLLGSGPSTQSLLRINPATASVSTHCRTVVPSKGLIPVKLAGLALSPSGVLYGSTPSAQPGAPAGSVYTINTTPVEGDCVLTSLGGPTGFNKVSGLAFAPDGRLYGSTAGDIELIEIDLNTGGGTLVTPISQLDNRQEPVYNIDGLAFGPGGLADCNENGALDVCDIADGVAADCNENGVLDVCELCGDEGRQWGCLPDCNANDVPDGCDIAGGESLDLNENQIPDECEPE